ncbi:FAS-associated factor 1 isoform X2 [Bacillus rossius redtenbacheri]
MPQETQTLPSEMDMDIVEEIPKKRRNSGPDVSVITCTRDVRSGSSIADVIPLPSTSNSESFRLLNFRVKFRDRVCHVQVPEMGTVYDLKCRLRDEFGVSPCQQYLQGWKSYPKSDEVVLTTLHLPRDNTLFMTNPNLEDGEDMSKESSIAERLAQNYNLNIHDLTNKKHYNLKFLGSKTLLEVKSDVYTLTDIPVRHQVWTGWPDEVDGDRTTLACSGINYPYHELTVKKVPGGHSKELKKVIDLADSDNSSVEEFEDASETFNDDDIFVDMETKRMQPLIPDNVEDETVGCIHFAEEFTNRYGVCHPDFYQGSLEDAVKEACLKPAKDRRLLAVYLHHDGSVLTNVFCTQLLGFESVLQCLNTHFVVWGWDLTHESNKLRFFQSVSVTLGAVAAMAIRNINMDRLPALIIIMRMRSATEIFQVVHGNVGVSELLTSLIQAVDVFTDQQTLEVREEEERNAREMVKMEQDVAYEQSLAADRAKEEAKRSQELLECQEREKREMKEQKEAQLKEANRLKVMSRLPDEPPEGAEDSVTKIRFRLPKGENVVRRFYVSQQLKVVLDFLLVKGYPPEEFKVISSWPRRDLTTLNPKATLLELKLCPQETLILEER